MALTGAGGRPSLFLQLKLQGVEYVVLEDAQRDALEIYLGLVAALGVTIGIGLYTIGIFTAALAILILFGLSMLERFLPAVRSRQVVVVFSGKPDYAYLVEKAVSEAGCRITERAITYDVENDTTELELSVKICDTKGPCGVVEKVAQMENVRKTLLR